MDAIFSGQAGAMAFLEGMEARVLRASNLETEVVIGREGVSYLFLGCNDVVVLRGTKPELAREMFKLAWEADRALRLLLLVLDFEEDSDLRLEAADCLEPLLQRHQSVTFIENQLYARPLPEETDAEFVTSGSNWPIACALTKRIIDQQSQIGLIRASWDSLASSMFDKITKSSFEEEAIRAGAFRLLASADLMGRDRNLAILDCHKALGRLPNARAIVTEWTKEFKRPGSKSLILPEDTDEIHVEGTSRGQIAGGVAFQNVMQQQEAIVEKIRLGSVKSARRFTEQLVDFQLRSGGAEFAAKSLCNLAQVAKQSGLHSLQLEWSQRAADINPTDSWAHGQVADALIEFHRLDEALASLKLAEVYGDLQFAAAGRARILRHQGQLDSALAAFRESQKIFAGHAKESFAWAGAAETLRDMWKFEAALAEYETGLRIFPDDPMLQCGRAAVLSDLGRLEEALKAYSSVGLKDDLIALNGRATVLKHLGRLDEALVSAERAIELYPNDAAVRCSQADILRTKDDLNAAAQVYSMVKKSHPSLPTAYSGFAEVLRDMRRVPEAVAAYREAAERFPFDAWIANGHANIRKVNDEYRESLQLYERNVAAFPYDLVAKSGRADLLKRLGHYQDALTAYDQIMEIWPHFAVARNGKAAVLTVLGRYQEAIELLSENKPKTQDDWTGWHIRGMVLLRSDRLDEAIAHFENASKAAPFARTKRLFDRALGIAQMRKGKFSEALDVLPDVGGGLAKVLHLHACAGSGAWRLAEVAYKELSVQCPERLIDLRDAIAARFKLVVRSAYHNDNWIFARESEALLQEAA